MQRLLGAKVLLVVAIVVVTTLAVNTAALKALATGRGGCLWQPHNQSLQGGVIKVQRRLHKTRINDACRACVREGVWRTN